MEPYVAEQVAREMLAKDPKIQEAFNSRLAQDADFAASPVKSRMTRQEMARVDQDARFPGGPGRLSAIGQ
jgi:hypothetical protein